MTGKARESRGLFLLGKRERTIGVLDWETVK